MPLPESNPTVPHDGLLLGYAPMDQLHDEFITLVKALACAPDHAVATALDALAANAHEHFDAEDTWMNESAFPARGCHIDEHAAVMRSIEGVQRRVSCGEFGPARRLAHALLEWFPGHADYLDSALAHWMCKRRLGGTPIVVRRHIQPSPALPAH